jgi:hypothetical protein
MKTLIFFLACFVFVKAHTQTIRNTIHTPFITMGAYAQEPDALSINANQASLVQVQAMQVSIMGERRFMLEDLGWYRAGIIFPAAGGGIGVQGNFFGTVLNKEAELGLAYGRKVGQKMSIGAHFSYCTQRIATLSQQKQIATEASWQLEITPVLKAGFRIYQPFNLSTTYEDPKLPAVYSSGLGYQPSEQLLFVVELQKEQKRSINCIVGIEYRFAKLLLARIGIQSETASYTLVTGLQIHPFRLDVMASLHPQLGITPGLTLHFQPKVLTREK